MDRQNEDNGATSAEKGIFMSKTTVVILLLTVVALLITEGLIIGLVARPDCESYVPTLETTKAPPMKTTTKDFSIDTTPTETRPWTDVRLPGNLIPDKYEISLRPILQADSEGKYWFKGSSSVKYWCKEPTNYLIIHSNKLEFNQDVVTLETTSGDPINIKSMIFYEPNQYLVLETDVPCEEGTYYNFTVSDFTGELADDLSGLYRSEYKKSNGDRVILATTHMQPTGARKTFPCFDEPEWKANFTITMWHRASDVDFFSISNMPVAEYTTQIFDGTTWIGTKFQETVPMSSYLLAMVVSDFGYAENKTRDNIQTKIYGREEPIEAGEAAYAALITPHILDFYADYFNVPYPLPKSDQLGIPDMGSGAMENWGLVIYREPYILYNKNTTSAGFKTVITSLVAHELGHQWFGNLVSPAWWDELWLNEGFATYLQYLGMNEVQPTWKVLERFVAEDLQKAFRADELTTSHPLLQEVYTPNEISAQFDTISYQKGSSILRMINGFLGEKNFVEGLTEYLNTLAYGVATHDDLFGYWAKHTDGVNLPVDLEIILETWTLQMGFPVVNVIDIDPTTNEFRVTQNYFLIDPDAEPVNTDGSMKYGYKWYIPFTYKKGSNLGATEETVWLKPEETVIVSDSEFILGNVQAVGYYRVNYDRDSWDRIAAMLDSPFYMDIPEENRAQLLDDAFSLASAQRLDITVPLQMASYLRRDDSYVAWTTFVNSFNYFEYMLGRTPAYGTFSNYILELVVPSLYEKYGWVEDDTSDEALIENLSRSIGIETSCYYGYDLCVNNATGMFQQWMENPDEWSIIPSTFRTDVMCTAIRSGGTEEWNFAWERYITTTSPQWQTSLRNGLACSKDPWILNRYLEYTLDATKIRRQDAIRTMQYIGGTNYGRDIAWAFMVDKWDTLVDIFGSGGSFDNLISTITRRFSTEYELQLLQDFKNSTEDLGSAKGGINRAIEKVRANIKWRAANEETVTQWLYDNVNEAV